MAATAARYLEQADAEEERGKGLPTLMSRVGAALKKDSKKLPALIAEWDQNGDGKVTLQEWRMSLRTSRMDVDASNVEELDGLFHSLDADGGGTLDLEEVKAAMKKCQGEAKRVAAEMERATAKAAHLRERAEQAQAAAAATKKMEDLLQQQLEVSIMLGQEKQPPAGEVVRGALGPRMYASMMKRGNKISELANKKHGRIDLKEFTTTVKGFVPAAAKEDIQRLFKELDVDGGGELDPKELVALMRTIQAAAISAEANQAALAAAIEDATLAAGKAQDQENEVRKSDRRAAEAAAEEEKAAAAAKVAAAAGEVERAAAAKAARAAKLVEEKAAYDARIEAKRKGVQPGVRR